jgi:hypothetical protein
MSRSPSDLDQFAAKSIRWNLNSQWTEGALLGFIPKATSPLLRLIPYPEITGYGVSLFANLCRRHSTSEYFNRAMIAARALMSLQSSSGGFNAVRSNRHWNIIPFDHVVITNAMIDCYNISRGEECLSRALAGIEFVLKHQKDDGSIPVSFDKSTRPQTHFYVAKAAIPFVKAYHITGDTRYMKSAEKLIRFMIKHFQRSDGGFRLDSEDRNWNRFHYLCYAVEGLVALEPLVPEMLGKIEQAGRYLLMSQANDGSICYSFTSEGQPDTGGVDLSATAVKALKYLIMRQLRTHFPLTDGGLPFGYHAWFDGAVACSWATQFGTDAALALANQRPSILAF